MKLNHKHLLILFLIVFLLTACGSRMNPDDHLASIYTAALDAMLKESQSNQQVDFLAIDTSNMDELSEEEIQGIIDHFHQAYGLETMEATFNNLRAHDNPYTNHFDGLLLRIEKLKYSFFRNVVISGAKYHAQNSKIETEIIIEADHGKWTVRDAKLVVID